MDSANDDRAAVTTTTVLYMWDLKAAWFQSFSVSSSLPPLNFPAAVPTVYLWFPYAFPPCCGLYILSLPRIRKTKRFELWCAK